MVPTVTVVIVNFNSQDCIISCLQSIYAQTTAPEQVLVVDNGSSDQSVTLIGQTFPQTEILELNANLGFAEACNRGFGRARGDLVALVNPDVVLDEHWLQALLNRVAPPWDFWASRILFSAAPERVDSAGDGMAVVGAAFKRGHGDQASQFEQPLEVFGACAAAALYRRSMIEALNGFDSEFFLIYEDADLNFRARLQGHRCLYVPEAVALHKVNASIGTLSETYVYYGHRNSEFVFWKNMPAALLVLYLPERLLFDVCSFFYFLARGRAKPFLKAKRDALRDLPNTLEKRREIQKGRVVRSRLLRRMLDRNWLRYRRNFVPAS